MPDKLRDKLFAAFALTLEKETNPKLKPSLKIERVYSAFNPNRQVQNISPCPRYRIF